MRIKKWLAITQNGAARITVKRPDLSFNEIAIHLDIEVPRELFTRPTISAKIEVPPEAAAPTEIDAGVVEDARQAIETATGLEVKIAFVDEREDAPA